MTPFLLQDGMPYDLAVNHMRLAHTDSGIVVAPRGECDCVVEQGPLPLQPKANAAWLQVQRGAALVSAVCRSPEA